MTNVEAIWMLQDAQQYLGTTYELTPDIKAAEDLIADRITLLWNDPNTNRAMYWR